MFKGNSGLNTLLILFARSFHQRNPVEC